MPSAMTIQMESRSPGSNVLADRPIPSELRCKRYARLGRSGGRIYLPNSTSDGSEPQAETPVSRWLSSTIPPWRTRATL